MQFNVWIKKDMELYSQKNDNVNVMAMCNGNVDGSCGEKWLIRKSKLIYKSKFM